MVFDITLSPTQQRFVATGLVACIFAVIFVAGLDILSVRATHHSQMSAMARGIGSYRSLIRGIPVWKRELSRSATSDNEGARDLFAHGEISTVAAETQDKVVAIISKRGAQIGQSSSGVEVPGNDHPICVAITVAFVANVSQLTGILYDIQSARPRLFATHLGIRSQDGIGDGNEPGRLQVDVAVCSYLQRQ